MNGRLILFVAIMASSSYAEWIDDAKYNLKASSTAYAGAPGTDKCTWGEPPFMVNQSCRVKDIQFFVGTDFALKRGLCAGRAPLLSCSLSIPFLVLATSFIFFCVCFFFCC
jgi:hypothetical protein